MEHSQRAEGIEDEETQLSVAIVGHEEEIRGMEEVKAAVEDLEHLDLAGSNEGNMWKKITAKLEYVERSIKDLGDSYGLQGVVVAAIHSLFKSAMQDFEVCSGST